MEELGAQDKVSLRDRVQGWLARSVTEDLSRTSTLSALHLDTELLLPQPRPLTVMHVRQNSL